MVRASQVTQRSGGGSFSQSMLKKQFVYCRSSEGAQHSTCWLGLQLAACCCLLWQVMCACGMLQ